MTRKMMVLTVIFCLCGWLNAAEVTLVDQNFDDLNLGELFGQGWYVEGHSTTAADSYYVQDTTVYGGEGKALQYKPGAGTWVAKAISTHDYGSNDILQFSYEVYADTSTSNRKEFQFELREKASGNPDWPWGNRILGVGSNTVETGSWWENFCYYDGASWTTSDVTFTGGVWWSIELEYNLTDQTFSVNVQAEGSEVQNLVTDAPVAEAAQSYSLDWAYLTRGTYVGATISYDNVLLTAVPEPATMLLLSAGGFSLLLRSRKK